jgi:hypothetical protein
MKINLPTPPNSTEILLYQNEDGQTRLEVTFRGETCWLSLNQLAELLHRDKSVISRLSRASSKRMNCNETQLLQNLQQFSKKGKK